MLEFSQLLREPGSTGPRLGEARREQGAYGVNKARIRSLAVGLSCGAMAFCGLAALVSSADALDGEASAYYVLDPDFPRPSSIEFGEVSWSFFDQTKGLLVLLQRSQPTISFWTPDGTFLSGWTTDALGDPHSVELHTAASGQRSVWITDMAPPLVAGTGYGHCLKRFTLNGELVGTIGTCGQHSQGTGLDPVQFDKVTDVAFDSDGKLFVTDGDLDGLNNRVLKLEPDGTVLQVWSAPGNQPGSGPKEFNLPHAVEVDACDRVWVADALNHRIQVIGNDGTYYGELACFGADGVYGLDLVAGAPARLFVTTSPTSQPRGGTVYVYDVEMICSQPTVFTDCDAVASWPIELPPTPETAMLHAISADPRTQDVYLSELGGILPPQKWLRVRVAPETQ